ncbi:hypothetical protein EJ110_NYTH22259 [Nymphaea thermarum]|nr:hypothetical protein EJ110_NYTH22259 [Nymphaea thermarum]
MVQMVESSGLEPKNAAVKPMAATTMAFGEPDSLKRLAVKLEAEDPEEEESGPPGKRSRYEAPYQQCTMGTTAISTQSAIYNPLDEPSPLGLRLRKSPSLLDLIQMRLSQGDAATFGVDGSGNLDPTKKRDLKSSITSAATDKLKASNFPASLLRIGSWECVSRYEGDLVAKCYFAKHKLVWEVLDGGLKSKIEIQWSDITALKATFPENGASTLDVVLARQPLFFRETNPQPRKHTLWQATSDFTGGQATIHRRHFLQVPHGLLNKHFEKLIQCDPRLNLLSQREDIPVDSPYFDSRGSAFDDQEESKCHGFDHMKNEYMSPFSGFQDSASTATAQTSGSKSEAMDPASRLHEPVSQETPSPSSVMDSRAIEEHGSIGNDKSKGSDLWEQFRNPALRSSMSMSDLVNHIENCITEQMTSGNPLPAGEGPWSKDALDEIAQYLLSDSQNQTASDEQCLMTRVNSLYCLMQKDTGTDQETHATSEKKGNAQGQTDYQSDDDDDDDDDDAISPLGGYGKMAKYVASSNAGIEDGPDRKQSTTMSRKDSLSDLLLNLPRIASLPQFLFNISDDVGDRASLCLACLFAESIHSPKVSLVVLENHVNDNNRMVSRLRLSPPYVPAFLEVISSSMSQGRLSAAEHG